MLRNCGAEAGQHQSDVIKVVVILSLLRINTLVPQGDITVVITLIYLLSHKTQLSPTCCVSVVQQLVGRLVIKLSNS